MIRVLHVYRTYFPDTQGGAEETIRQICANTLPFGVESRVCTVSKEPPKVVKVDAAEVHRFPLLFEIASCGVSARALGGFRRLVEWADLVHYHFPWPFADFLHFAGGVRKPTVLTYHSDIVRQRGLLMVYKPVMHSFLKAVDAIVATSPNYFESSKRLAKYAEKVEIIPIGLGDQVLLSDSVDMHLPIADRIGEGFFLFIGVLRYYKGLNVLLDAVQGSDVTVVIAGTGPVEGELKKQAVELGLRNVIFLGYVSDEDKAQLLRLCRAVVFPSHLRAEAFGVTLVEGAMFGKPLISTDIGTGTSYVNERGVTGLVVKPDDPTALRNAMESLNSSDELCRSMGLASRARYEELFSGERMGEKYAALYRRLISQR